MDKEISDKLETLLKYIPFIDFVLKIDKQKYVKFIDIRKWITIKKRYPLSDLIKIEQSIITQYKNLLLVDDKIPKEIMKIFNNEIKHQFVNLCSDDDEDEHTEQVNDKSRKVPNNLSKIEEKFMTVKKNTKKTEAKLNKIAHTEAKKSSSSSDKKNDKDSHKKSSSLKKKKTNKHIDYANGDDSDNDLQIVSFVYLDKHKTEENPKSKEQQSTSVIKSCDKILSKDINLDDISEELLKKIDNLNDDDNKTNNFHEPINYNKHSDDDGDEVNYEVKQENLFQRRKSEDALFKRRDDFKKEPNFYNLEERPKSPKKEQSKSPTKILETISLDSSSASEGEESLSNVPTTSAKARAALKTRISGGNGKIDTTNLDATKIADGDLNRKSNVTIITNLVNVETLNSETNNVVGNAKTQKINIETVDHADVALSKGSKTTDLNHCLDEEISMGLLDMDIDTENELNDVLNEINNPADSNIKTTDEIYDDRLIFRNSSPPLLPPADSVETNSNNKENSTTSTDNVVTNAFDATNLKNLSQDQIFKIFEDIEGKSDFEIDKLLQALSKIFQITTPTCANNVNANISPETPPPTSTEATNIRNDLTPPAPHFIPITPSPQQQQPQTQQPIFYPNPLTPPFVPQPPPQQIYQHPTQHYLQQQQQQQVVPPHQYNMAPNFITPTPMSRINLKDPRIIRKLQIIKDSPLWSEFNRKNAEILSNAVCRKQQQQHFAIPTFQQQHHQHSQHPQPVVSCIPAISSGTPALINNRRKSTTKSTINFGEYKRRQMEQQQELERKREEEKKRKKDEAEKLKDIEMSSLIFSALEPFKDTLTTIWGKHRNNSNITTCQQSKNDETIKPSSKQQTSKLNRPKESNDSSTQKEKDSSVLKTMQEKSDDRINRVYKELECTFIGFDQIQDYVPNSIGGKRRSSVHARSSITEQLNSYQSDDFSDPSDLIQSKSIGAKRRSSVHQSIDNSDTNSDINSSQSQSQNNADVPKLIGGRRRSSVTARLAIVEQLNDLQEPTDYSDSSDYNSSQTYREMPKLIAAKRRASTIARSAILEQLQQQQTPTDYSDSSDLNTSQSTNDGWRNSGGTKRRKTIDEPIYVKRKNKTFILRDESSSDDDDDDFEKSRLAQLERLKENILKNPPTVVLERISQDFIRKHTRRNTAAVVTTQNVLNVHLVESKVRPSKVDVVSKPPPAQKLVKPKKLNNDCQMTERKSKFCALCTSKPSDLTNHYRRKHKSESYVSRLTWSQLEDLCFNTPFAKLQPKSLNSRIDRYQVDCPFCDQHLLDPFISLYNHYSTHTGEYAYRCSHCQLDKPYRADIQSHQLHSKTCRNSNIQVLYRYPPNVQCIYLHYCTICNFVQLNEANILKHLREHHDPRKAVALNVEKCILAAISDAPDVTDSNKSSESETSNQNADQENINITQDNNITQDIITVATSLSTVKKFEMDFKVDDDDIPVNNEACSQDTFEEGKFSLEEQLKQMHEEPLASKITPMTVIHCGNSTANINRTITPNRKINEIPLPTTPAPAKKTNALQKLLPMILQGEAMDVDENLLITPPRPSVIKVEATRDNITTCHKAQESVALNQDQTTASSSVSSIAKEIPQTNSSVSCSTSSSKENPQTNSSLPCSMNKLSTKISTLSKSNLIYDKYHNYPENVNYLGLYKCMADDCYYSTDSSDEILKHLEDHTQDSSSTSEYLQCPYCIISANGRQITALQLIEHIRSQHQHQIYQCSICCYRSCEASNVLVHQQHSHVNSLNATMVVYKCTGPEINFNERESYINDKIIKNVRKISCPNCSNASFYNSNLIVQHLIENHKIRSFDLKVYSCIYCQLTGRNQNNIRKHLSTKHPEELPYIYDHNNAVEIAQDPLINNSNILSASQPVSYVLGANTICDDGGGGGVEEPIEDVKPELEELMKMNEDTIKVRLRKLTAHTGLPPDSLYRCPESSCGGFFSIFNLWLRHMRIRHHCLECQCPHCPAKQNKSAEHAIRRPLESYASHFEEHRRHTFICFYCSTTSPNELLARQHAAEHHSNFADMRLEQIRFNVNYSYFIMIQSGLFTERMEFISEFLSVIDKRLLDMESIAIENLKHQWLIQPNALWLENVPNINNRRFIKKCLDHTCKFRSVDDDTLFRHMNTNHGAYRAQFNCRKCHHQIVCNNWNDIFEHRKLHLEESVFICVACFHTTANRSKLAEHIREQHAARDVPVVEHIKTREQTSSSYIKLAVVFANNHLTFSTIRNCFCCDEKNMNGDAFNLHLRRYHSLTLNYFCEWCINTQFKSLEEVKSHFQCFHPTAATKIRCQLAFNGDLIVTSLDVFQLQIVNEDQKMAMIEVKKEPIDDHQLNYDSNDDDVVILEMDDIVIQESLKNHELATVEGEKPKLKCVSMNNLLQAQSNEQPPPPQFSNHSITHLVAHQENGQSPSVMSQLQPSTTSTLNCFQNHRIVTNQPGMVSTVYGRIPTFNNTNSTFNTHTLNVHPGSSAPNLTTTISSNTTNNQNFANVNSQYYVLPNTTNLIHANTINKQNLSNVGIPNYVLHNPVNTLNTFNNPNTANPINNQNYAITVPNVSAQNNARRY